MKLGAFLIAAATCGVAAAEVVWSGAVTVEPGVEVTCTDHSAVTSLSVGAGATVRFQTATAPGFPITGSGTVVKDSTAEWTMTTASPDFKGDYVIAQGVASTAIYQAFGCEFIGGNICVSNGATLSVAADAGDWLIPYRTVHISGSGVDGRGALEMPAKINTSYRRFNYLELDGDARLVTLKGGLFFLYGRVTLNGHRLTVAGGNPSFFASDISTDGEIYLEKPTNNPTTLTLRSDHNDAPGAGMAHGTNPFILSGNTSICIYNGYRPVDRPLWVSGTGNTFTHSANNTFAGSCPTNHANWIGPVVFTNETGLSELTLYADVAKDKGACLLCVSGPISGNGSVKSGFYSTNVRAALLNAHNTYTGETSFNNNGGVATLLGYPGSVPDYTKLTSSYGYVDLAVGDEEDRWTLGDIYSLAKGATLQNGSRLRLTGEFSTNACSRLNVLPPSDAAETTLTLGARGTIDFIGADNETPWDFRWYGGTARFRGPKTTCFSNSFVQIDTALAAESAVVVTDGARIKQDVGGDFYVGGSGAGQSRLVISNATWCASDPLKSNFNGSESWSCISGGTLGIGYYGPGILEVGSGAVVTNRLIVSTHKPDGPWSSGGMGAVYQRGGEVVALGASSDLGAFSIGQSSRHGYYELDAGSLVSCGKMMVGGYGSGVFHQYGGSVLITNRQDEAASVKKSGLYVSAWNGGKGQVYIRDGSFTVRGAHTFFCSGASDGQIGELTLDGENASFDAGDAYVILQTDSRAKNLRYTFNFNGGVFTGYGIVPYYGSPTEGSAYCVNFNGGTIRPTGWFDLFAGETTRHPTNLAVYAKGMTVDVGSTVWNKIGAPIRGAWGKGVSAIALAAPFAVASCVGAPIVKIDGDGLGASAVAHFDSAKGIVDEIIVTSPGCGYTTATASFLAEGQDLTAYPALNVTLAENANTGSFRLKGNSDGVFTLTASNSWGGATIVEGAKLKTTGEGSLPPEADVVLEKGGVLDLANTRATIRSVSYGVGGGTLLNAGNAELPQARTVTLTTDDVLAERTVTLSGAVDLSSYDLVVTGSWPTSPTDEVSYSVLVSDGAISGTWRSVTAPEAPADWRFAARGRRLTFRRQRGLTVLVR